MAKFSVASWLFSAALLFLTSAFLRLLYVLPSTNSTRPPPRKRHSPTRLLIVLGSGGHTAEMLALLRGLDISLYTHRSYIVSAGDDFSAGKAKEFEKNLLGSLDSSSAIASYDIAIVPRARNIHQSLLTTPISAAQCLFSCSRVLLAPSGTSGKNASQYPDLILINGPGTAVCVVFACLLLRFCGVRGTQGKMRTIYVESWARVKRLSLSGKILAPCVDRFLVQWESLRDTSGRAEYLGVLV